ncbi:MAG: hypothetical protein ACFFC3_09150, partial [Candidatus Odinarchaeota archaeon]
IIPLNSEIRIYFYKSGSEEHSYVYLDPQIVWYDLNNYDSENPNSVYNDPDQYDYYDLQKMQYLLNIGDVNSDGFDDLFAISLTGRYLCLDIRNNNTLWVRTNKDFEVKLTEINDLNSNGYNDFLVQYFGNFEPNWITSNAYDYQEQITENPKIIYELFTIDGKTGTLIWTFNIPSPLYYEGIRDLKNVGDINDDEIDDYVGWIIPSTIPSEISDIIEDLTGEASIDENYYSNDLYRTLLFNYIKLIVVNGSNGSIIWNTPLIDFPYKFYRQYGYSGSYFDPISGYSNGDNYFNRINGEFPNSWGSYDNINWSADWDTPSLKHPSDIEIIKGTEYGKIFDLWGDQGTNYSITSYNSSDSSKSLKLGSTADISSIGTVESNDGLYWVLNSLQSDGNHHISAELSFKPSQIINSELKYISIGYTGLLFDDFVDQFNISIYNFNDINWKKVSTNVINKSESVDIVINLNNLNGLTGVNNLVKIKIEATNTSAFSLYIDKLVVDYIYTYKNYTVIAELDGTSWKTIFDFVIPIDFSDEEFLGAMEYPLSQIERFSALKLETNLAINTTNVERYNFTYEIKDVSSNNWILCNWSETPIWNNHTYPDLKGGYGGYRNNYNNFTFGTKYREDFAWLITRGTYDADPYVELDYENPTTLSDFIDSNKNIRLRVNVTNNEKFNLTIDSFGIGVFYWGLFSSKFDRYYLLDYDPVGEEIEFTTDNLLNIEIQDFDIVNGTSDKYLDIVAIIGIEGVSVDASPEEEWSTRICLFDIRNKETYTKWSPDKTYIPYQNVRILAINNSLNNWILSGIFQFGSTYNCSHKLVSDPHWETQITHFENYDESKAVIDFVWEEIPEFPDFTDNDSSYYDRYEFPGITYVSKNKEIGIILGEYDYSINKYGYNEFKLSNIRIIDINDRTTISKIPIENLEYFGSINSGQFDFSSENFGFLISISYEDFNNDSFLDHVGIYKSGGWGDLGYGTYLKIYSGNSSDLDPLILYSNFYKNLKLPSSYKQILYDISSNDNSNKLKLPFTSIDDINDDGIPEALTGVQTQAYEYDLIEEYMGRWVRHGQFIGSYIDFYDVYNSNKHKFNELSEYKLVLDPLKIPSWYGSTYYEFIFSCERFGDINADNYSEVVIYRDNFQSGEYYVNRISTTEILDPINQNILYRFNIGVNFFYSIDDINQDGKNELLVISEESIYCVNSKFNVQILSPNNEESMDFYDFNIVWNTNSDYDYFEVFIDGISQGSTKSEKIHVSIGAGWRQISITMHDKSGLIISTSTINVLVPSNYTHLILTFILLGAIASLYVIYRRYSKKKRDMVLIDREVRGDEKRK